MRVPRGLAWQRDVVAGGTTAAALFGTLYTLFTLLTLTLEAGVQKSNVKRRLKGRHAD